MMDLEHEDHEILCICCKCAANLTLVFQETRKTEGKIINDRSRISAG